MVQTSVDLLLTAFISTTTASCYFRTTITTYRLLHSSVRLLLLHSSVHLLLAAFISTSALRLEVLRNEEVSEPPPSGAEQSVSICPASPTYRNRMPPFSEVRCDSDHMSFLSQNAHIMWQIRTK